MPFGRLREGQPSLRPTPTSSALAAPCRRRAALGDCDGGCPAARPHGAALGARRVPPGAWRQRSVLAPHHRAACCMRGAWWHWVLQWRSASRAHCCFPCNLPQGVADLITRCMDEDPAVRPTANQLVSSPGWLWGWAGRLACWQPRPHLPACLPGLSACLPALLQRLLRARLHGLTGCCPSASPPSSGGGAVCPDGHQPPG